MNGIYIIVGIDTCICKDFLCGIIDEKLFVQLLDDTQYLRVLIRRKEIVEVGK